jgi:hypothetical protein
MRELKHFFSGLREAITRGQLLEHARSEAIFQLADTPKHGGMIHGEPLCGRTYGAAARDGEKVANVVPIDHPSGSRVQP